MIQIQIAHNLNILFVGINPHPGSYRRGVPFSNNKMFWYLLHAAGLLSEPRELLQNDASLLKIYRERLTTMHHLGLINMIDRPTRTVTELKREEAALGRARLLEVIHRYKPKIVCFVGKAPYQFFADARMCDYGWQESIDSSRVYIMHTPLRGLASVRIDELRTIMARVKIGKKKGA